MSFETEKVIPDTPTHRLTLEEFPEDLGLKHLEEIRIRRMQSYTVYKETKEIKLAKKLESTGGKLTRNLDLLEKELQKLDDLILKIEKRCKTLYLLRVEHGTINLELTSL